MLLVSDGGQRRLVERCCEVAAAAGVRPGMTLAHARALLPLDGVRVEPFRPRRDEAALRALAAWAVRFTPLAAPDPPDGLLLDVTGCERLYGGEGALVDRIAGAVANLGLRPRLAVAPTLGCAWAVARYGRGERAIIPEGGARAALAPLPLAALRIEAAAEALAEVGVTTIGQLMALPRSSLPSRFGTGALRRLDQALGTAPELLDPVRPVEPVCASWTLAGPTTDPEAAHRVVRELVGRLCAQLAARESGAQSLELDLRGPDMAPVLLTATLSRPSRSPAHLWSLLRPQLERTHLADGVESFTLLAPRTRRLPHEQAERWREGGAGDDAALAPAMGELIDILTSRLGADRVLAPDPAESHRPEQVVRFRPILDRPEHARRAAPGAALADADRPSVLFERPEPVNAIALAPDGAPRWLSWRGAEHHLTAGLGPERIGPEWWRRGGMGEGRGEPTRDYFKVQDRAGLWLWVFHEPDEGRWFVHGVWA